MQVLVTLLIIIFSIISTVFSWLKFGKEKVMDSIDSSCGTGSMAEGYLKVIVFNLLAFFFFIILFSILFSIIF